MDSNTGKENKVENKKYTDINKQFEDLGNDFEDDFGDD